MKILITIYLLAVGTNASTVGFITSKGNVGLSGIVRSDNTVDQFGHDLAHDILFFGPSGVVTKSGRNLQFTSDLHIANPRNKRALYISRDALLGSSGAVNPDGKNVQFTPEQVGSFILKGSSGIVASTGENIQFTRRRRSIGDVTITRDSGIVQPDGNNVQFIPMQANSFVVVSPSDIVTPDGKNIQFHHHSRRDTYDIHVPISPPEHFRPKILVEGPSAYILTDGTLIQKNRILKAVSERRGYSNLAFHKV